MKFRVRFRPTGAADWPELIDIFDLPIEETQKEAGKLAKFLIERSARC